MSGERIPPVRKAVTVLGAPADAFARFTEGFGRWWPLASHSIGREDCVGVVMEPGEGGRIVERTRDGAEHVWGRVRAWEPGVRLVFSWHPGREPESAQDVEVRFVAVAEGTRVELEHGQWEALGVAGAMMRDEYEKGWDPVFVEGFGGA